MTAEQNIPMRFMLLVIMNYQKLFEQVSPSASQRSLRLCVFEGADHFDAEPQSTQRAREMQ
jgi:hypothetical protein